MKTISEPAFAAIEVRRSRFLAYLVPLERFAETLEALRAEHPKANHIARAYRRLDDTGRPAEGYSDDGEPRGCAGMPVLSVLRGNELIECALLVVRYFGGVKLGTGGMARAYADAAAAVVAAARLREYRKRAKLRFSSSYAQLRRWEYEILKADLSYEREYGSQKVDWIVEGPAETLERLGEKLGGARIGFLLE